MYRAHRVITLARKDSLCVEGLNTLCAQPGVDCPTPYDKVEQYVCTCTYHRVTLEPTHAVKHRKVAASGCYGMES